MKVHCNNCNGMTNHTVLHEEKRPGNDQVDEHNSVHWCNTYQLLSCNGCEEVHMIHQWWFSEAEEEEENRYPPRVKRNKPRWLGSLTGPFWLGDTYVEKIIAEIYIAISNGSDRLAAMGVRALLEFIMIDKIGDQGSFIKNIEALLEKGFVTKSQQAYLKDILEIGHATMHRQHDPSSEEINTCLDILETLIESLYVHPDTAKELTKRVTKRAIKAC